MRFFSSERLKLVHFVDDDPTPIAGLIPSRVGNALRSGLCPKDRVFDRFLMTEHRLISGMYWTPLVVATRAAQWFDELGIKTVLDVGSGAGKFCVAAALASKLPRFIGLEHRSDLVSASRDLARRFEVEERITFVHGTFGEIPTPSAEAYYFFNPFGENLFGPEDRLDATVELGNDRFLRDVASVERLLIGAPVGTYLLTYNGYGGTIPTSYREVRVDRELPNVLRMWRKVAPFKPGQDDAV